MAIFGEDWSDPKTALWLTLAGGLLGGRGNLGQNIGAGLLGAVPAYQGARKMQDMQELHKAQIEKMQAEAERARKYQQRGLDPNLPAAIQIYEFTKNLQPDERVAFERGQRQAQIFEMNGIRYFNDPTRGPIPLTTLEQEAGAQATIAGAKQRAQEVEKATYDLMPGFNAQTNRMEFRPRIDMLPSRLPPVSAPGSQAGFPVVSGPEQAARDAERVRILQSELAAATDPVQRAAIQREIDSTRNGRAYGAPLGAPRPVTAPAPAPVPSSSSFAPPEEAKRTDARNEDEIKFKSVEDYIAEAKKILPDATASGVGTLVDKGLGIVGMERDAAKAAERLRVIGGWLTSNVPRMEGPQSNYDVQQYREMAAQVGDSTLPTGRRLAALETLDTLMKRQAQIKREIKGSNRAPASNAPSVDDLVKKYGG